MSLAPIRDFPANIAFTRVKFHLAEITIFSTTKCTVAYIYKRQSLNKTFCFSVFVFQFFLKTGSME